jgi:kumamolisin
MDGVELAMGGTSAVAPMWAALTARINQQLGVAAGCFLPILYEKRGERLFGEIVSGGNGRFEAGADWNPCTGLGVPNGIAIESALRDPSPPGP